MSSNSHGHLEVKFEDWQAELEALRQKTDPRRRQFTEEQDQALLYARGKNPPVTWRALIEWWAKRWGPINADTLRARLRTLQKEDEE